MRTKTLLISAVLSAASIITAVAQTVYSVNVVGFVNVNAPPGFSMIANPLNAAENTVAKLITGVPDGTILYKFNEATGIFAINLFDIDQWTLPGQTLNPGEGAFIRVPGANPIKITFIGEVMQGVLSNPIPAGFSIRSSQVPQKGQLDTELGFPAVDGDIVYRFNPGTGLYSIHLFDIDQWTIPPVPEVGEAFFVKKVAAADWTRTFNVQ